MFSYGAMLPASGGAGRSQPAADLVHDVRGQEGLSQYGEIVLLAERFLFGRENRPGHHDHQRRGRGLEQLHAEFHAVARVRPLRMSRVRAGSSRPSAAADFTNARITSASPTCLRKRTPGGRGASFASKPSGAWSRATTEFSRMRSFLGRGVPE